jgi:hypothetical protein
MDRILQVGISQRFWLEWIHAVFPLALDSAVTLTVLIQAHAVFPLCCNYSICLPLLTRVWNGTVP